MLLTMNWRNEIKNRISMIDVIKENLTDVEAELEEVRKRNPLVKTKSVVGKMIPILQLY